MSDPVPARRSELASLVDAEDRLDRQLVAARATASAECEAAKQRAEAASATLAIEIDLQRERAAVEITATTAAQLSTIDAEARAECARFDAVVGEVLAELADRLAARLAALALEEAAS